MGRTLFRLQASYFKTYRVGGSVTGVPDTVFTTIQAAINQAVADGATLANRALVEVYYTDAGYLEGLTFASGVDIIGIGATQIVVAGNCTYAPVAGDRSTNRILLKNIIIAGAAGADSFTFGGTVGAQIELVDSFINRELEDGFICFRKTNTQGSGGGAASARVIFNNSGIYLFDSVNPGLDAVVMENGGRFTSKGTNGEFGHEGGPGNSVFNLQGNAQLTISGQSTFGMIFTDGAKLVELNGTSQANISFAKLILETADKIAFDFINNCNVTLNNCYVEAPGDASLIGAGAAGDLNLTDVSYLSDGAKGFNNIASTISVNAGAQAQRFIRTKEGRYIISVGSNYGFETIQEAFDYAMLLGSNDSTLLIEEGFYTEDVDMTLSGGITNIAIIGNTLVNARARPNFGSNPVTITGTVTVDQGAYLFQNINFESVLNQSAIILQGTVASGVRLANCSFVSQQADATPIIALNNTGAACEFFMNGCTVFTANALGGKYILDMSGGVVTNSFYAKQTQFSCNAVDILNPVSVARVLGNAQFEECNFGGNSSKFFELLAAANFVSQNCYYGLVNLFNGSFIRYAGAGASVTSIHDSYRAISTTGGQMIARDNGSQATALIAQTSNVYAPGDGYNVNGTTFVNGVDFAVGGTAALTAINIAAAINASISVNILNKIYAIANGDNVELYDYSYTTAGNAYTLALIGTAPAVLTAWAGGANGVGGAYVYSGNVYQFTSLIQAAITRTLLPVTVTPTT